MGLIFPSKGPSWPCIWMNSRNALSWFTANHTAVSQVKRSFLFFFTWVSPPKHIHYESSWKHPWKTELPLTGDLADLVPGVHCKR